jgi:micrococcal nuclease
MYDYTGRVIRVVDGDTLDVEIDLGFHVSVRERVRLAGINCPEINTDEGKAAAEYVKAWVSGLDVVEISTIKTPKGDRQEKYGRYLAVIMKGDAAKPSGFSCLNQDLIKENHASFYGKVDIDKVVNP